MNVYPHEFFECKWFFPAHARVCSAAEKKAVLRTVTLPIPLQVHMCFISWLAHWTVNSNSEPAPRIRAAPRLEEITGNKRQEWEVSALSFFFFCGWMFPPMCLWVAFHLSLLFPSPSPYSYNYRCLLTMSDCLFSDLDLGFPACSLSLQLLCLLCSCSLKTEAVPLQQTLLKLCLVSLNDGFHLPWDQITHSSPPPLSSPNTQISLSHTHTNISTPPYLSLKFMLAC